jgi:hypothetical protein
MLWYIGDVPETKPVIGAGEAERDACVLAFCVRGRVDGAQNVPVFVGAIKLARPESAILKLRGRFRRSKL